GPGPVRVVDGGDAGQGGLHHRAARLGGAQGGERGRAFLEGVPSGGGWAAGAGWGAQVWGGGVVWTFCRTVLAACMAAREACCSGAHVCWKVDLDAWASSSPA
ncbi:hypothetical protein ADK87_11980, partial [Streptomyces sp. NRRL F-4711]